VRPNIARLRLQPANSDQSPCSGGTRAAANCPNQGICGAINRHAGEPPLKVWRQARLRNCELSPAAASLLALVRNRLTSDGSDYRIWASSGVQLRLQHSWGFISADTSLYDSQERATPRLFMGVLGTLSVFYPAEIRVRLRTVLLPPLHNAFQRQGKVTVSGPRLYSRIACAVTDSEFMRSLLSSLRSHPTDASNSNRRELAKLGTYRPRKWG